MKINMKRFLPVTLAVVFTLVNLSMAAYAGGQLKEIKAYINEGITIKVDGLQQNMADAKGRKLHPISYEGSTYVPIRAISEMLGKQVKWDGATQTVLIGDSGSVGAIDFIDGLEPYDHGGYYRPTKKGRTATLAGKLYDHYMQGYGKFYYNLEGKYKKITFQAYYSYYSDIGGTIRFFGDNDVVLKTVTLKGKELPTTHTVDVTGVQRMVVDMPSWELYLFNATIE